jgi:energy-coupling factor transport system ATP-binding protein
MRADYVIVLNKGKLILEGTPKEVFANTDKLKEIHLDAPFVMSLIDSLRKEGVDVPSDVDTLEKLEEYLCQ